MVECVHCGVGGPTAAVIIGTNPLVKKSADLV